VLARIHANRGADGGGAPGADAAPQGSSSNSSSNLRHHAKQHGSDDGDDDGEEDFDHLIDTHSGGVDLFDRAEEISTFSAVSAAGLGPQLLMLFRNGRLEEFLVE